MGPLDGAGIAPSRDSRPRRPCFESRGWPRPERTGGFRPTLSLGFGVRSTSACRARSEGSAKQYRPVDDLVPERTVGGLADRIVDQGVGPHFGTTQRAGPLLGGSDQRPADSGPPVLPLHEPALEVPDGAGTAPVDHGTQRRFDEPDGAVRRVQRDEHRRGHRPSIRFRQPAALEKLSRLSQETPRWVVRPKPAPHAHPVGQFIATNLANPLNGSSTRPGGGAYRLLASTGLGPTKTFDTICRVAKQPPWRGMSHVTKRLHSSIRRTPAAPGRERIPHD